MNEKHESLKKKMSKIPVNKESEWVVSSSRSQSSFRLATENRRDKFFRFSSWLSVPCYQCRFAASLKSNTAEALEMLTDTIFITLFITLELCLEKKYCNEYSYIQMKSRCHRVGESLQELVADIQRFCFIQYSLIHLKLA